MANLSPVIGLVAAAALGAALTLSSCGTGPKNPEKLLTAAEAGPGYQQLSTDVGGVLSAKYPALQWETDENSPTQMAKNQDGVCILSIGTLRAQEYLSGIAGGWDPVIATIAPLLKDAGFAPITEADSLKGGWTGISSSDGHGGTMRIVGKSSTEISVSAKVSDTDCTLDTSK